MATKLSRYFEERRIAKGLKPGQLAALAGCINISKNANRIRTFEITGKVSTTLLEKLIAVLEIDTATIQKLAEQDHQEFINAWLKWVNEPITPSLSIRLMPAFYSRRSLPPEIMTMEQAEEWAAAVAKDEGKLCCLVWSRKISCWFDNDGVYGRTDAVPGEPNCPWMRLGKSGKAFVFGDSLSSINLVKVGPSPIQHQVNLYEEV